MANGSGCGAIRNKGIDTSAASMQQSRHDTLGWWQSIKSSVFVNKYGRGRGGDFSGRAGEARRRSERLVEIVNDVVDMLDPDSRTYPGVTPVANCSSAESCECVGWMARLRESPILAT